MSIEGWCLPLLPQCLIYGVAEGLEQEGSGDAVRSCMKYRPLCKEQAAHEVTGVQGQGLVQQEGLRSQR